jgi:hypothetical protein
MVERLSIGIARLWSAAEVAAALGIHPSTFSRMRAGLIRHGGLKAVTLPSRGAGTRPFIRYDPESVQTVVARLIRHGHLYIPGPRQKGRGRRRGRHRLVTPIGEAP